jgi:hypothetical protein
VLPERKREGEKERERERERERKNERLLLFAKEEEEEDLPVCAPVLSSEHLQNREPAKIGKNLLTINLFVFVFGLAKKRCHLRLYN